MIRIVHGVVRGQSIEIAEDVAALEGQAVEVEIRSPETSPRAPGEGILSSAGGWADYPELDAIMERIQAERKLERRSQGW